MKKVAPFLLWTVILSALATPAFAETRTISWALVTTYSDGTPIEAGRTITYSAYWTTDPGLSLASLHTIGTSIATTSTTFDPDAQGMTRGGTVYFTAKAVLNTGEASALSPGFSWVVPIVATPGALSVTAGGLTSSGRTGGPFTPSSVSYTLTNTGGTSINWTAAKTQTWVTLSSASGALAAGGTATVTVTINSGANGLAASSYSDTVTLTNTTNGMGNTTRSVGLTVNAAIVDVTGSQPAVPKNIGISGPISSGPAELWRVTWDPVTTYADDAPLEPGRTVHYTVYWTDDPTLSPASLRILASSITAGMVDFDPLAYPMVKNHLIYLTAQAVLDTGDRSSHAESVSWRVANAGPVPPGQGKILKK